jgi:foldase protein PrsA
MSHPSRALAVAATALLGLAVAGCSSGSSGGGGGDVATVNDQKISRAEFDAKLEAGPQGKQVLQQLVQAALIDQYAKDNKIEISDADVAKQEDDIKSKYPPGQFEQILKSQNLTENDVHNILRQKLIVEKGVGGSLKVTDADISAYLSKNHATLDTAEQVRAKHILVANLPTAEIVEGKLKSGGDFAALAKQYSTDPSSKDKGGELGFFGKGQMVPAFQAAAFSQPIGAVGAPVKSPFATLANSRDKIKALLQQQQEQQQIPAFLANLRSKANIVVLDSNLKDALPPAGPAPAAGTAAAGAAPAPSTAASP